MISKLTTVHVYLKFQLLNPVKFAIWIVEIKNYKIYWKTIQLKQTIYHLN